MAQLLGVETLIPIHYEQDVWSHFKEDVPSYQRAFQKAGLSEKTIWLSRGVRAQIVV
jgi:hypothetical protein